MPRLKAPAPDAESRKALEQRAREAAKPAPPAQKGRWPFSVQDNEPTGEAGEADSDHAKPDQPARPGKPRS
ncbi:hypothetical protein SAMN05216350_101759 [Polaromonas sp. YR568]|uniref:hypothetical protein n=1 Tax=Polaromonas sp. YR568 TaxID=1855301 RepID=UPI0008EAB26B|nr:hypothetical protein [Polaromonas sp. YR568]SFU40105.1 hypothetical protein SAMN05216350_101759 [Polaromonas sp. YR568]